jgi:hypothetical protein
MLRLDLNPVLKMNGTIHTQPSDATDLYLTLEIVFGDTL